MDFIDRDKQRNILKQCLDNIQNGIEQCIWIEGDSGTGKTYFVKYMKMQEKPPVYVFNDYNWLYKCSTADVNNEFSYITALVSDLQEKHPIEFNEFLVNYFDNINSMSWIEILVHLLPNIKFTKWAKDIIENSSKKILDAKNNISSRLYAQGLPKFFSELIIYILAKVENKKSILFCIDDACWLDDKSIKTINIILNMLKSVDDLDIKLSFAVITRGKEELIQASSNYTALENTLKDHFETIQYIYIKNFTPEITKKYVEMMGKNVLLKKTTIIYKMTEGNPQELYQALKIDEDDLLELCQQQKSNMYRRQISNELIYKLINENICILPILGCISLMRSKLELAWLLLLVQAICVKLQIAFSSSVYDDAISLLRKNDLINNKSKYVEIVHDSIKEETIRFLYENGEYVDYVDALAQELKIENSFPDATKEIFYLLNSYNDHKCFEYFIENYSMGVTLDADIYKIVAQSLTNDVSLCNTYNLNTYIIPVILRECVFLSLYDIAYELCCIIYPLKQQMNSNVYFQYLIFFLKILIDMALLNPEQKYNAVSIINEALQINNLNSNQQMEGYLLAMSAYEHILDFEHIIMYEKKAEYFYKDDTVSAYLKSMFLRNQGLVDSHIKLKTSYEKALHYAEKICDVRQKNLMLGTCYNNLGLSYWYSGDVEYAKELFFKAKYYLESIGYDIFRVLNNISMCYLLEGDLSNAYKYILQAKALNVECVFEKLCIQSNLSIIEWKTGKKVSAKQIVCNIYNEYIKEQKQTTDELVYCSAMVNLGYFYFCEKEYIKAAQMYKNAEFFNYRYNNDDQLKKRQKMRDICLFRVGILSLEQVDMSMDLNENKHNVFKCMYAPITFAYYII